MRFTHKNKFKIKKFKTCYIPAFANLLQTKLRNIHKTESWLEPREISKMKIFTQKWPRTFSRYLFSHKKNLSQKFDQVPNTIPCIQVKTNDELFYKIVQTTMGVDEGGTDKNRFPNVWHIFIAAKRNWHKSTFL